MEIARTVQEIAKRLYALRQITGLRQGEFAAAAGISANTYNQYEQGKGRPEIDKAIQIAETYMVTLDWIYRGETAGLPLEIHRKLADLNKVA